MSEIADLTSAWLGPLVERLNNSDHITSDPKIFNDPVWGSIVLQPQEILLLDTPLLQRLRAVKQLGMAHMVYQGAGYGRLEHICGVVEGCQRLMTALDTSAARIVRPYPAIRLANGEAEALRLAALLHDIGHGSFSHVVEDVVEQNYNDEIDGARNIILSRYKDVANIHAAELLSVLMVLSEPTLRVLLHARFPVPEKELLPLRIVSYIVGSSQDSSAPYLGSILSGPIDADKLDYMVRDSHHAGLAIGLESTRLLSQLQVAHLTEDNAPTQEIRSNVSSAGGVIFQLGISRAGVSAYEQMIASRTILYDRVYYHHKVRTAEAMIRRLITSAEADLGRKLKISELLTEFTDDTFLFVVGGLLQDPNRKGYEASEATKKLAISLIRRNLYNRAFAFASRYIAGFDGHEESEKEDTKYLISRAFLRVCTDSEFKSHIEMKIIEKVRLLAASLPEKFGHASAINGTEVLIDLPPPDRVSVNAKEILVCAGSGNIELPNLYFNPEKWMKAYRVNKMIGFVYTPAEFIEVVNLASKIVFAEEFSVAMTRRSDRVTKTSHFSNVEAIEKLSKAGQISSEVTRRLSLDERQFIRIHADMIELPNNIENTSELKEKISNDLFSAKPLGYLATEVDYICSFLGHLLEFCEVMLKNGDLKNVFPGEESKLQKLLLLFLRSKNLNVTEGEKLAGGESDLLIDGRLIIENKIHKTATDEPLSAKSNAMWQARRYAISVSNELFVTVHGYVPKTELGLRKPSESFSIAPVGTSGAVELRFCVPIGYSSPSLATM